MKCISCASPIVKKRNELDKIIIELVDDNNIKIGSVEIIFKYMKKYLKLMLNIKNMNHYYQWWLQELIMNIIMIISNLLIIMELNLFPLYYNGA